MFRGLTSVKAMSGSARPSGVLIAGPTASGKSQLALLLAEELEPLGGATIINSDSMQVYRDLRLLTARPSREDELRVPHRLYGVFSGHRRCSAGRWCELAADSIAEAQAAGRTPIVVGGTGLYFQALVEGLAPVPDIPAAVRNRGRARLCELGNSRFHEELSARDPAMASRIRPSDQQRMLRAWEVVETTGVSLADWQNRQTRPQVPPGNLALPSQFAKILLSQPRESLYQRCDLRFDRMIAAGVVEEVRTLLSLEVPASHPIMKAVGVREIARHLAGEITLDMAVAAGQQATRRYAKRQMTWFRSRMVEWQKFDTQDMESFFPRIFSFIRQFLLTP